ncbi:DsbE family thiol:disulfide interchange protein [Halioxenophilus sp. WMMB6]|uniref:DsbE family thiol:disulfide interchange protein n=1 Tax=Halioxenophilus sp. WMMB6 TaxID=3073815 RepID=UPI00295E4BB5|nr:DsbE family thiol:disulfide interchange protein [Halioxenophilus sp. WMMB6]
MKRWQLFLPLGIFLALALLLGKGLLLDPTEMPSALIDKAVPEFTLPTLSDSTKQVTAQQLIGKPYLLNVWATWCISCRVEHPFLVKLSEQGVKVIGINYKDDTNEAKVWLNRLGNPYTMNIVDQDGRLGIDLGVFGAPETYFVDSNGVIRYKHIGVITEEIWQSKLAAIFSQL